MSQLIDLSEIEAARQLAALSPETQAAFERSVSGGSARPDQVSQAFRAIGAAIARKREPVSEVNKRKLFAFADQLLKQGSHEVANAVATCMLESLWTASRESGFDFGIVDPFLGPEARRYLVAWDDFNKAKTEGLTRPRG